MPKGNKAIPRNQFRKDWQERVRTWFDQPAKARKRRFLRNKKAAALFPRPIENLKPVVHAPSLRWNMKVRLGRGFTLEELKEATIEPHFARTIGISVDLRRKNRSDKTLKVNVQRLKEYKSKLILFPKNSKKVKQGEATKEQIATAKQHKGTLFPIQEQKHKLEVVKIADIPKLKGGAYATLRKVRIDAKRAGIRAKRAKEKAEKAALEKKPTAAAATND